MSSVHERLHTLLEPLVESLGCELWGLEYLTQGKHMLLRLYIDKAEGIGLEECELVSRHASSLLDVEDPIKSEYTLEVSSPGVDRPLYKLAHYQAFIGAQLAIRLKRPFDGRRKFSGLLKAIENDEIVLQVDQEEYLLPYELIDKANIIPQF